MIDSFLDRIAFWIVRGVAFIMQRIPLRAALLLGALFGRVGYYVLPKRVQTAYVNLRSAFPESTVRQRKQWIKQMFSNLGMNGAEMLRFPILTREEVERYVNPIPGGYETYLESRWKGGLILLTQHLGNWELSQMIEGVRKRPITVLARHQKHKRLDDFLNYLRQCHGTIAIGKGGEVRDMIRSLREGGCVGILADQSGGDEGIWIRFFGRLTTAPRGPIALGLKLGVKILPVFFVRNHGPYHDLMFEPDFELVRTGDYNQDVLINTQNYVHLLETYLKKYPGQWLWAHKRWKRTRTKRILILSDGKPGHVKQSEALAKEMIQSGSRKAPPYEMPVEKIEVRFRSPQRKKLFSFFSFFLIPWATGRLNWLRFFFTSECSQKLESATPDVIISAGSSLVPLNLCLAQENSAKSVVLMKPSFPFNLFRYDLALVPQHDQGFMPAGHFRIHGAFNGIDPEVLQASKESLASSLTHPERIKFSLFLGGETRNFKPTLSDIETLLRVLERACQKSEADYAVTTSRRTPEAINRFLKTQLHNHPRCKLCVIASEDVRPEVVPGMMGLADCLIVTEDSLSMISEALGSGKKVVVLKMSSNGLPPKHYRFQEELKKEWGIPVVSIDQLAKLLESGEILPPSERWLVEKSRIREKVEALI